MFWILKAILFGELVTGGFFAFCLLFDWLATVLSVHFQSQKKDR